MQQETLPPHSGKTYYLDSEYWRATLYLLIGVLVLAVVSQFRVQMQGRGIAPPGTIIIMHSALFVFGLSFLLPRLRIDGDGIHRRLFFWYWDLWPWEEFRSGEIREGMSLNSYRRPSKPFWRRKLLLEAYPAEARVAIEKVLKQFTLKPQIEIPESISLKLFSEQWEFREAGITLQKRNMTRSYDWEDIESVSADKLTHEHQGFRNLEVKFADKTLTLRVTSHQGQRIENWKGAQPEEILAFFLKQVPEDRIEVTARHGPPQTVAEANRRLERIEQQIRAVNKMQTVMIVIIASLPIIGIIDQKLGMIIYSISMAVVLYVIGTWIVRRGGQRLQTQRKEINDWLKSEGHSDTLNAT